MSQEAEKLEFRKKDAFTEKDKRCAPVKVPAELRFLFDELKIAFYEADFSTIDNAIEKIETLNVDNALKGEIERIKDAVMMMEYDNAIEVMRSLLKE